MGMTKQANRLIVFFRDGHSSIPGNRSSRGIPYNVQQPQRPGAPLLCSALIEAGSQSALTLLSPAHNSI